MEYTAEQKLKILSDWLQDSDDGIDPYYDGQLERSIKIAKKEVKQEIGNYLKEILNGDKEFLQHQLNSSNGNWCHPDI